jgi:hypothetical protein
MRYKMWGYRRTNLVARVKNFRSTLIVVIRHRESCSNRSNSLRVLQVFVKALNRGLLIYCLLQRILDLDTLWSISEEEWAELRRRPLYVMFEADSRVRRLTSLVSCGRKAAFDELWLMIRGPWKNKMIVHVC